MVMLQTTNNIFDTSLYKLVRPQSLLSWQRVRLANMMAHTGQEWYQVMSRFNSGKDTIVFNASKSHITPPRAKVCFLSMLGTYNNQYMVIDLKKIHLKLTIEDNALWVVEQIPGLVVGHDQTDILRTGILQCLMIFQCLVHCYWPVQWPNSGNGYVIQLFLSFKVTGHPIMCLSMKKSTIKVDIQRWWNPEELIIPTSWPRELRFSGEIKGRSKIWLQWRISWDITVIINHSLSFPSPLWFSVRLVSTSCCIISADYLNDPYSDGKACNTICCRGDLSAEPRPSGCYDTKVCYLSLFTTLK